MEMQREHFQDRLGNVASVHPSAIVSFTDQDLYLGSPITQFSASV